MITVDQEAVAEWVAKRAEDPPDPATYIGMARDGKIVGAIVFWHFQYENGELCELEFAMWVDDPHCFTRGVLKAGLRYAFGKLQAERLTARIAVNNHRSLRLAKWTGFQKEGYIRRGRFTDHWLLGLTRQDYERRFQLA